MPRLGRLAILGALALTFSLGGGVGAVAGAQSSQPATDPCTLLRVKEVEKTLGQKVRDGTPETRQLPGTAGTLDRCAWLTKKANTGFLRDTRLQFIASVQSNCAQPDVASCFRLDKNRHRGETFDVKKVGDDAFYVIPGEVEVLVGDRILNVHFNNFDRNMFSRKDFQRRTVDAAKKAVRRL